MALLEGMRSTTVIKADIAIGDTVIEADKTTSPMNYNLNLLLEVFLDIRAFHDALLVRLGEVKTVLDTIETNTTP